MLNPPDWISVESWEAFHEMRRKIKAPLTAYAERLAIVELAKLKAAGHDPQACLDQSILNSWRGIFAPRDSSVSAASSAAQQTKALLDAYDAVTSDPAKRRAALEHARKSIRRVS